MDAYRVSITDAAKQDIRDLDSYITDELTEPAIASKAIFDSAHSPLFEEPEKATEILLQDVLTGQTMLADQGDHSK